MVSWKSEVKLYNSSGCCHLILGHICESKINSNILLDSEFNLVFDFDNHFTASLLLWFEFRPSQCTYSKWMWLIIGVALGTDDAEKEVTDPHPKIDSELLMYWMMLQLMIVWLDGMKCFHNQKSHFNLWLTKLLEDCQWKTRGLSQMTPRANPSRKDVWHHKQWKMTAMLLMPLRKYLKNVHVKVAVG